MQGIEDRIPPPARFDGQSDRAHELAIEKHGAHDFGPDDYLEGLRVLLLSLDYDDRLSERGRVLAWGAIVTALAARAFSVQQMQTHGGFDARPVTAPVVITGIPRTGTTALHKLLAVDGRFQGLDGWLIPTPMPRPPRNTWHGNSLYREAVERIEARYAATPERRALHSMAADEVDECIGILRLGFVSNYWASAFSATTYDLWWQTQSELPSYEWLHKTYQLIGALEAERRWLLKNPGHIDNLEALFELFPDARVIITHRDPASAIPSLCSMLGQRGIERGEPELRARRLGLRETEKWARAIRRSTPVRAQRTEQILDVRHADFHREPMRTVERIYEFASCELTPDVRTAMTQRIEAAPELPPGRHRYDLADFGLPAAAIRERFEGYVEEFDLAAPLSHEIGAR